MSGLGHRSWPLLLEKNNRELGIKIHNLFCGLTSQSTIFQSCQNRATTPWEISSTERQSTTQYPSVVRTQDQNIVTAKSASLFTSHVSILKEKLCGLCLSRSCEKQYQRKSQNFDLKSTEQFRPISNCPQKNLS